MKPYIHLLKTINSGYFYDVNKNEIVSISEECYQILDNGLKHDGILGNESSEIISLINKGYLSDKRVKKIEHPETENVEYYLDRKLGQLILQVTQGCNLKCGYCSFASDNYKFFRSHSSNRMSWEVAQKAIDYYLRHSVDSDEYYISFYGGEPLLAYDLIVQAVNYVHKEYPYHEVKFGMTTNGTLLKDEKLDFLVKNNFILTLSIDGPKKIHDFNRRFLNDGKGSYDLIMENVRILKDKYPDFYKTISTNMVIDPMNSYADIVEGIKSDKILNELRGRASLIDDRGAVNKVIFPARFNTEYGYSMFLAFLDRYKIINFSERHRILTGEFESYDRLKNYLRPTESIADVGAPSGPCVPGKLRWFVRYDGKFYPCEKVSELSEFLDIGNVDDGLSVKSAQEVLNIAKIAENRCKDCWVFRFCNHCAAAYDNGGRVSNVSNAIQCYGTLKEKDTSMRISIFEQELKKYYE